MMAQRTSKKYMNMAHSEKNESVMMMTMAMMMSCTY